MSIGVPNKICFLTFSEHNRANIAKKVDMVKLKLCFCLIFIC